MILKINFKRRTYEIKHKEIPVEPCVGTINGLWEYTWKRRIIPIETNGFTLIHSWILN